MYKVVIIEDDPLSQEALKDILHDFNKEFAIVACYASVAESVLNLAKIEVDLVLLDMELLDGQGFDILKAIGDIRFEIIITTMYDSFMLEAIKHSAIDYLQKPILKNDLASALDRFKKKMQKVEMLKSSSTPKENRRLVVPDRNGLVLIEIDDVIRLQSDGAYTKIFVVNGDTHLISKNLGHYETSLAADGFLRIHNKHLVNISQIKNYMRKEGGSLIMSDNSTVEVSRRKKQTLLNSLKETNGVVN
ncbi:MAG: two-component system LytT family response regulator [Bacteroidia bacterium]|jgi:two-component system LytT family response regulator